MNSLVSSETRRSACFSSRQSSWNGPSDRGSSDVGSFGGGPAKNSSSTFSSFSSEQQDVGVGGGADGADPESNVGIAPQTSGVKNAFGKAAGIGATGPVLSVSTQGASPWVKMDDGGRERKEERRAVMLVRMKLMRAMVLSGTMVAGWRDVLKKKSEVEGKVDEGSKHR